MDWTSWLKSTDLGAHFFFQSLRKDWLDPIMKGLTHAGDTLVAGTVAVLAALAFLIAGRRSSALAIAVSACLGVAISESVKSIVKRERPPEVVNPVVSPEHSWSFPSSHALCATAIYGAVGLALARLLPSRGTGRLIVGLGFAVGFVVGLTRLYLGVHFLFDVIGGWTAGVACALFGRWVDVAFGAAGESAPARGAGLSALAAAGRKRAEPHGTPGDIHLREPDHYRPS
jgi:undecaprenyl-diphosphatase